MTHFSILNSKTYDFMLQLRANSPMWFGAVVECTKHSVKTGVSCIDGAVKNLKDAKLDSTDVNVFQIATAARAGLLDAEHFGGKSVQALSKIINEINLNNTKQRLKDEGIVIK